MKRMFVGVLAATMLAGLVWGTSAAFAAPPNRVSLTLTCDKSVDDHAQVSVFVQHAGGLAGSYELTCGPNSFSGSRSDKTVQYTSGSPFGISIASFFVVTTAGTTSCSGDYQLPAKVACVDALGVGATLVAR